MTIALWDDIRATAMICQFTPELIHLDIFDFRGNQVLVTEMDMPQSLTSKLAKRQIQQLKHRASVRLNNILTTWSLLRELLEAATSVHLRAVLGRQRGASMTPRRDNL